MKRSIFLCLVFLCGASLYAQDRTDANKAVEQKVEVTTEEAAQDMVLKEHVCTAACKEGAHAYACGEKGHVCSAECHKAHGEHHGDNAKEHVCSASCTKEAHAFACGEKGHVCTAACHKH